MQLEAKGTNSSGIIETITNQFRDVSTRKYLLGMDLKPIRGTANQFNDSFQFINRYSIQI